MRLNYDVMHLAEKRRIKPQKNAELFCVVLRKVLRGSAIAIASPLLIASLLSFGAPLTMYAGFGISPPSIKENKLLLKQEQG